VPIVTDEQVLLLEFARKHAQGTDERLFRAEPPNRSLERASVKASIEHVTPHSLDPHMPELHEVDGRMLTLDAWAAESGIPKSTLYFRVVLNGISMKHALAMVAARPARAGTAVWLFVRLPGYCREILAARGRFRHPIRT